MTDELQTVYITNDEWDATLLKQELEEAGIRVHLAYESARFVYGLVADGLGQMRVQVLADDENAARELADAYVARQAEPAEPAKDEQTPG